MPRASLLICPLMDRQLGRSWLLSIVPRTCLIGKLWASKILTVRLAWEKRPRKRRLTCAVAKLPDGNHSVDCFVTENADRYRDYELRFTVHESPDYYRLKVSVFNDDKKTDMIGETWVDLRELIIPGGGQSDNWHPLQYRGRYAGEVRIEMTFYDTRVQDEAVIERRSHAAGKIQARTSGSTSSSSTVSGPRQPKDIRRRPLPTDPNNPTHVRPPPPEKLHTAPAPSQLPSVRAPYPEQQQQQYSHHHTYSMPTHNGSSENLRQPSRHSMIMPTEYDVPTHAPTGPRPARGHESPDDFQRQLSQPALPTKFPPTIHQPAPVHPPVTYPQATPSSRYDPVEQQHSYREPPPGSYALQARSNHGRPHSSYDGIPPPMDYRVSRQDLYQNGQEQLPPAEPVEPRRNSHVYETRPHQPSTQDYPFSSSERFLHGDEPVSYEPASNYALRHSRSMPDEPPHEYVPAPLPELGPGPEQDRLYYRQHSNSIASTHSSLRNSMSRGEPHVQYSRMQPKVEDEEDEGPPPPPPVHRSGLGQSNQQLVPSPRTSYRAYSPEYASSPSASDDVNLPSQPSHYIPDNVRLQDLPPHTTASSMPPSLVAGFDPGIADTETDRMYHERKESKRRSVLFEEDGMVTQPPASQPPVSQPPVSMPPEPTSIMPPYPVDPPTKPVSQPVSQPAEDRGLTSGALVRSRGGSVASDSRIVPRRKSVSPQPPPVEARSSGTIPFSPDSYDALNPNASRSAQTADPAREYDSPTEAMEAARRSEAEAKRDPGPIIDDNGREIDPSDHLPSDTWAPEPEKKNRKPELVVRFKNPPAQSPPPARESRPLRVTFKPSADRERTYSPDKALARPNSSYQRGSTAVERTSPRMDLVRGRDAYTDYNRGRDYSRSPGMDSYSSSRKSVSPSPGSHTSSLYAPASTGPPIPAKVPIAQPMNQSYPIIPAGANYNHVSGNEGKGMDALSRELNTIDIGSVGYNTNRAVRKYVPRVTTGYAV